MYLISGSQGFLARNLIRNYKINNKLLVISRKKKYKNLIKLINLDLSKNKISKSVKINKVDYVIHVASVKMNSKINPLVLTRKNFNIISNLIKLLKKVKFKKIINISSTSLYYDSNGNFNENSSVNFLNNSDYPYAFSKYFAEKKLNDTFKKKKILHLRVAQIFGNNNDNSIVSNFKKELRSKNVINIYGNGKRVINLIHINKLIRYIDISIKKKLFGVYNIADYSLTLDKIAKIVKFKYGNESTKICFLKKIKHNPKFFVNSNKFFNKIKITKPKYREILNEI